MRQVESGRSWRCHEVAELEPRSASAGGVTSFSDVAMSQHDEAVVVGIGRGGGLPDL